MRALRHRNYRLFFFGQAVSVVGSWMTRIATAWLVYRLTDSAWMLGVVGFAQHVPTFLLGPIAGTYVDRWNRRSVLIVSQASAMIITLALAALTLSGLIAIWQVLLLSVLEGLTRAFDVPARQAMVVDMVEDRNDLPNAIALNSSIFNGGRLIGPAIGGAVIAWAGEGLCYLVDGVSYTAVILALVVMRLPPPVARSPRPVLVELREGFGAAFGFPPIRALLVLVAAVALLGVPYMTLMPVFARDVLGGDAGTLGVLMGSAGAGALMGALYLASRSTVRGLGIRIATAAAGFALTLVLFSLSPWLWLSSPLVVAAGFSMMVVTAGSNTIVQTLVDDDKRGRVMSLFATAFLGSAPVGNLLAGRSAEWVGAPATVAAGGVACAVVAAIFALKLPVLRALARPIYVQRGIIPEVAAGLQTAAAEIHGAR